MIAATAATNGMLQHRKPAIPRASYECLRARFRRLVAEGRAQRIRSLSQFVADEIVIAEGPYQGRKWRPHYQPYQSLLFREIDSGRYSRIVVTGNVQSGKSFCSFVAPALYHLCELKENIILAAPTIDIGKDKWEIEIEPVLRRSRYADLLPTTGRGSRGGFTERVDLANGASLKFMSGHGGDEKRSSFTARVVIITEADKMDTAGEASKEASPIRQILARSEAWDLDQMLAYAECTVSVEGGFIWREFQAGTASRLIVPCPHCHASITPEQEHFEGVEAANTVEDAERDCGFACPSCRARINEEQRQESLRKIAIVHTRESRQLGFRWSAYQNAFWSTRKIAHGEWKAANDVDEDDARKYQTQFVWVRPYVPPNVEIVRLDTARMTDASGIIRRGLVPEWSDLVTVGLDLGKYSCYWVAIAWRKGLGECPESEPASAVIDYGILEVPGQEQGTRGTQEERALEVAIGQFLEQKMLKTGFLQAKTTDIVLPSMVLVDAGFATKVVRSLLRTLDKRRIFPIFGRGSGQHMARKYAQPTRRGRSVYVHIGEEYHAKWNREYKLHEFEANVDFWKSWLVRRLATQVGPGSMAIFAGEPRDHRTFLRHLTAEEEFHDFDLSKNKQISRWERIRKANHYFDAATYATIAAAYRGVTLLDSEARANRDSTRRLASLVQSHKQRTQKGSTE